MTLSAVHWRKAYAKKLLWLIMHCLITAQCIEGRVLVWRISGQLVSVSSLLHHMTAQQQLGHRSSSANAMQSFRTLKQYPCRLPALAFGEFADCTAQPLAKHSRSAQQRGKDSTEHHNRYRGHLSSQSDHKHLTPPTRRLLQSPTVTQSLTASSLPAKQPSNNSSIMSSPQPATQSQVSQQNSSKNSTAGFVVTWPALPRRSPNPPMPGPETKHAPSKSGFEQSGGMPGWMFAVIVALAAVALLTLEVAGITILYKRGYCCGPFK